MRELKIKEISWISLVRPTADDIKELRERFPEIHPLILEELLTPTIRPKVENYDHYLFMVLHFINFIPGAEKSISYEFDFILMPKVIITTQYEDVPVLEEFWHECESRGKIQEHYGKTPVHLLYYLLRQFFSASLRELDQIQEAIDALEEKVFTNPVKDTLEEIANLKRDILDFRRTFRPQQLTLDSLIPQGVQLYGENTRPFLMDIVGEYLKVWNLLETHKEALDALYDTSRQLLATRTNEIMRVFTILAFISFIPTAVANIYGMNIAHIPLAERPGAFWMVLLIMILLTGVVYAALKWKKLV